jgi:DNA-binding response OmpR family regulator
MHILVADDDVPVAKFISGVLEAERYEVRIAGAACDIYRLVTEGAFDLIILDLNLSDVGGRELLRQVRTARPFLPVLIISGNERVEDRVAGLDSGADDYLTKPFAVSELSARVRALLRRTEFPFEPVLRTVDLKLDRVARIVIRNDREVALTPREFGLLEYLMLNAGRNVSRSSIIQNVWKLSSGTLTNVVDVYINYLRRKIDADGTESLIHTVRGDGYRIGTKPNLLTQQVPAH